MVRRTRNSIFSRADLYRRGGKDMDYLMYLDNMLQFYGEGTIPHDNLLRTIETIMAGGNDLGFHDTSDSHLLW